AAAEEEEARRELAAAAPRVYLVGRTPDSLHAEYLGAYDREPELVNGRLAYAMAGDADKMLWFSSVNGYWHAGPRANLGGPRGWLAVYDRAPLPERVAAEWQVVAKLLIVATFVEDALRVLFTFGVQQQSMEIAGWTSPALHTLLPLLSLAVQSCGALLVLASSGVGGEVGCYLLLGWCVWHPFMYGQAGNREFVLETATISGGLLILLSHLLLLRTKAPLLGGVSAAAAQEQKDRTATAHRIQAVGRVLVVSFFLYVAATKTHA
ncbi:hypothetical protein EMIHUDRAFT_258493, partial [Emiliania huxleyi CCMP1516]|uniref:Uncharacterized protein n=2 Tax=Emiliania huxleyi TaxID=2903 RepID=A0A0D3I980_EMIH1